MRDAFGGVFMIRLMLVFVFIFVAFAAISLNYAKAFRIKNNIIDFVEQEEIINLADLNKSNGKRLQKLDAILDSANYNKVCRNGNGLVEREAGMPQSYCYRGIYIEEISNDSKYITYEIHTFADWNLGPLNLIINLSGQDQTANNVIVGGGWVITGKAKVTKRK